MSEEMDTTAAAGPRTKRRGLLRRILGVAVAAGLAAAVVAAGAGSGGKAGPGTQRLAVAADEAPGYAVEDFDYPGADRILADRGIELIRGDGHITLATCTSGTGQLEAFSRTTPDPFCFQVTGDSGWLTLQMPSVYLFRGNDYTTQIDMTTGTDKETFDVVKNTWTSVGETADPDGRTFSLVEIRATK